MKSLKTLLLALPILLLVLIQVLPVGVMILTSLKSPLAFLEQGPLGLTGFSLENYERVVLKDGFLQSVWTSAVVAASSAVAAVGVGSLAAYGLARIEVAGRRWITLSFLLARLLPPVALAIPLFLLVKSLGLIDTRLGLVLAHTSFNLPFAVWLLLPFFEGLPKEVEEAGALDGCTRAQLFRIVVFPMALPGLMVAGIFCFLQSWNDFLFSLILAGSQTRTAPLGVNGYMTGFGPEWGPMTAASSLILLPVFVFSFLLQRHIVSGLGAGAVKS